jgi:glutamate/tyrosine decarboxylase-like PLP-dependent enzyme
LNVGIENSRRFRALPLYMSLVSLGRNGYEDIFRRNVNFARRLESWMREGNGSKYYQVLTPSTDFKVLNILLFTSISRPGSNPGSVEVLRQMINQTGKMYVTQTIWRRRGAIRLAVSNWMTGLKHETGEDDFEIVVKVLTEAGERFKG